MVASSGGDKLLRNLRSDVVFRRWMLRNLDLDGLDAHELHAVWKGFVDAVAWLAERAGTTLADELEVAPGARARASQLGARARDLASGDPRAAMRLLLAARADDPFDRDLKALMQAAVRDAPRTPAPGPAAGSGAAEAAGPPPAAPPAECLAWAEERYGAGDVDAAIEALIAVAGDAADAGEHGVAGQAHADLAVIAWELGDAGAARTAAGAALAHDPRSVAALEILARAAAATGDRLREAHWLGRATEADPDDPALWRELAGARASVARWAGADEAYAAAAALEPLPVEHVEQRDRVLRALTPDPVGDGAGLWPPGRVLVCVDLFHPSVGGTERLAEHVGTSLQELGWEVAVACRAHPDRVPGPRLGMDVHEIHRRPREELRRIVARGRFAAVLALGDPYAWPVPATLRLPASGPRTVVVPCMNAENTRALRRDPDRLREWRELLGRASVVVQSSEAGFDAHLLADLGVPGAYVPNAVERVRPEGSLRTLLGLDPGRPTILCVSNLYPSKNQAGLLEALAERPGTWQLVLVGHPAPDFPEEAERVERLVAADPRVRLVRGLPPELVAAALAGGRPLRPAVAERRHAARDPRGDEPRGPVDRHPALRRRPRLGRRPRARPRRPRGRHRPPPCRPRRARAPRRRGPGALGGVLHARHRGPPLRRAAARRRGARAAAGARGRGRRHRRGPRRLLRRLPPRHRDRPDRLRPMTPTPTAAPSAFETWREQVPDEVAFWESWARTRGREWPEDFLRRFDPKAPIDGRLGEVLAALGQDRVRLLDVGAGPVTVLGKTVPGKVVEITAVDPLADAYAGLLERAGPRAARPDVRLRRRAPGRALRRRRRSTSPTPATPSTTPTTRSRGRRDARGGATGRARRPGPRVRRGRQRVLRRAAPVELRRLGRGRVRHLEPGGARGRHGAPARDRPRRDPPRGRLARGGPHRLPASAGMDAAAIARHADVPRRFDRHLVELLVEETPDPSPADSYRLSLVHELAGEGVLVTAYAPEDVEEALALAAGRAAHVGLLAGTDGLERRLDLRADPFSAYAVRPELDRMPLCAAAEPDALSGWLMRAAWLEATLAGPAPAPQPVRGRRGVARLDDLREAPELLDAWARAFTDADDVTLVVVLPADDPRDVGDLERLVAFAGLDAPERRTSWPSWATPSRTWSEPTAGCPPGPTRIRAVCRRSACSPIPSSCATACSCRRSPASRASAWRRCAGAGTAPG
jgi:tetratricopeptide (TPR) repeat protein